MFSPCQAGFFDDLVNEIITPNIQSDSLDNNTVVKGLKEALATGTERAIKEVAKPDGYFGNDLIKILLPGKIQQAASVLSQFGYQQQVDALVLSMNRALVIKQNQLDALNTLNQTIINIEYITGKTF